MVIQEQETSKVDFWKWRAETLEAANKISNKIYSDKIAFQNTLSREIRRNPVDHLLRYFNFIDDGFHHLFGFSAPPPPNMEEFTELI